MKQAPADLLTWAWPRKSAMSALQEGQGFTTLRTRRDLLLAWAVRLSKSPRPYRKRGRTRLVNTISVGKLWGMQVCGRPPLPDTFSGGSWTGLLNTNMITNSGACKFAVVDLLQHLQVRGQPVVVSTNKVRCLWGRDLVCDLPSSPSLPSHFS